jgi:hypothetical protein
MPDCRSSSAPEVRSRSLSASEMPGRAAVDSPGRGSRCGCDLLTGRATSGTAPPASDARQEPMPSPTRRAAPLGRASSPRAAGRSVVHPREARATRNGGPVRRPLGWGLEWRTERGILRGHYTDTPPLTRVPKRIVRCILSTRMRPEMRHFVEGRRSDAPPPASTIARRAMLGRPCLASRQATTGANISTQSRQLTHLRDHSELKNAPDDAFGGHALVLVDDLLAVLTPLLRRPRWCADARACRPGDPDVVAA